MTRWIHPPELERQRGLAQFDPLVEGTRFGLSRELSLAIWQRVCAAATNSKGRRDTEQAERRFREIAARIAARGGRLQPDVGRLTRVETEAHSVPGGTWALDELAPRTPGRTTLVAAEMRRWRAYDHGLPTPLEDAGGEMGRPELPGAGEVKRAMAALQMPSPDQAPSPDRAPSADRAPPTDQAIPLEPSVVARMGRLFDADLTDVKVVPESPEVTGSTKAITKDDQVHFRPGAYQPGTPEGDWLIAHELAHVVQQRGGHGERTGARKEIEREADRAASLAVRGRTAPIQLRAERAAAYAFDDSEAHDSNLDETADKEDGSASAHSGDATKTDARASEPADPAGGAARAEHAVQDHAAAEPAGHGAPEDHADHDDAAAGDEAAIGVIPAEESPAAPPAPAGGEAARPQKPAPEVAAAKPEVGLGQLRGVRPDKLGLLFGQIHTAAHADVAQERARLEASPPKQMSTGAPAADKGAAGRAAGAPKPAIDLKTGPKADPKADAPKAGHDLPDHPVKPEVPGGEAAKQAQQAQAAEQQKSAPQVVAGVARSIASWFSSWFGHGESHDDDKTSKMSESETRQMSGSLEQLPTTAQGVSTEPGPAPELAMKGQARTSADQDRAKLEATTAGLETQGRADSRAPMGEDHIETTIAPEELTAAPSRGAAPKDPALPTAAGAASSEEVGIVAQEQHGAEIDAALGKASADATAERGKHAQEEQKAKNEADAHVREFKTKADADQAAARASAQAEVQAARSQWQAEIDKKGQDARKQADKKVADGMAQVAAEEAKANAEAKQHIDEGKRKAEEEKQKGEKEAADAKEKGKQKSSGFFGWIASKAKAAFDGIKKAVHAAIDACKRAVKAVIDAAKKLAMAAIELARKVIVAAIKAVGQALIAISNVLLAAFPALKTRFQNAIRNTVDKAVATVNKVADGLKKAVHKALDLLGAALDKALSLLEKGLDAIVDAANAVVQGAIKAAQAVVETLGTWAKLIKDIVSGPAAWLGKLGAAIWDGIKNHLWSAFKTTVLDWFKSKVFELLGVGGVILELLLEGGLTKEHIIQMALDALMTAIPAALVAILIEKLVAMIVPAAGALMAIIEGLQAAWGTISRIIAALSAFMAFLLAVKGGGAGALFAGVLASAAVVVLDFVANWLLKKLASAARKVGAKLKGLAEKFKAKRKAKKDAKAAKKHHDGHGDKKQKDKHDDDHAKAEKDKQKEILEHAIRVLQPKVASLMQRGVSRLRLSAQLLVWKVQYRLSSLSLEGTDGRLRIVAKVNPEGEVQQGFCLTRSELLTLARKVAAREVRRRKSPVPKKVNALLDQPTPGRGKRSEHEVARRPDGTPVHAREYQQQGHTNALVYGELDGKRMDIGSYGEILKTIQSIGMTDANFATHMTELVKTGKVPAALASDPKTTAFAGALRMLMFNREATRNPMALLTAPMALEQVASGRLTWSDLFTGKPIHNQGNKATEWGGGGMDPMSMTKAPAAARTTYEQLGMKYPVADPAKLETTRGTREQAEALQEREKDMLLQGLNQKVGKENLVFNDKQTAEIRITRLLIGLCREWYGKQLEPVAGR